MSSSIVSDEHPVHSDRGTKILHAITVCVPAAELHAAIHDRAVLAQVIPAPGSLHWLASDRFEFWSGADALTAGRIINDKPGELIAWQTEPDANFPHAGTIRLQPAPGDEGTELLLQVEYEATLGEKIANLFGKDQDHQAKQILRRLKALLEAGEIPTIAGQAAGEPQRKNQS